MHGWPLAIEVEQMVIPQSVVLVCASHTAQDNDYTTIMATIGSPDPKKHESKRSSGRMRQDYLSTGAFLIEFKEPTVPVDMWRRQPPMAVGPPALLSGKDLQSAKDSYRTMERKGFRVTKDTGCLIPDAQYSTYQGGATLKGHQRSFQFFGRWMPKAKEETVRNEYGWPMNPQISHLCHRRSCCRIDHLVAEEQWRNLKRNYCGYHGSCDCGSEIECLRRYQMENQADEPEFCKTVEEVEAVLAGAPKFTIHGSDRFANRDVAAAKRKETKEKRKRRQEIHQHQTAKKQKLKGGQALDVIDEKSD